VVHDVLLGCGRMACCTSTSGRLVPLFIFFLPCVIARGNNGQIKPLLPRAKRVNTLF
jgi:hypothetical protein